MRSRSEFPARIGGRFHVVHTHATKGGIVGRLAARLAGAPVIVHTLHSLVFHEYQSGLANRTYILLKRICAPLTDQFISVSRATAEGAVAVLVDVAGPHPLVLEGEVLEALARGHRLVDLGDGFGWAMPGGETGDPT